MLAWEGEVDWRIGRAEPSEGILRIPDATVLQEIAVQKKLSNRIRVKDSLFAAAKRFRPILPKLGLTKRTNYCTYKYYLHSERPAVSVGQAFLPDGV